MEPWFRAFLKVLGPTVLREPVRHRGTPSDRTAPPCGLGIFTARTGGKDVPDDNRFQILYRVFCRSSANAATVS